MNFAWIVLIAGGSIAAIAIVRKTAASSATQAFNNGVNELQQGFSDDINAPFSGLPTIGQDPYILEE